MLVKPNSLCIRK